MMVMRIVGAVLAAGALLVGCSSEPTEIRITETVVDSVQVEVPVPTTVVSTLRTTTTTTSVSTVTSSVVVESTVTATEVSTVTEQAAAAAPAPEPAPAADPEPVEVQGLIDDGGAVAEYYANCSDAKAAGAAPLYRGDPGYRSAMDRDGDGVACE